MINNNTNIINNNASTDDEDIDISCGNDADINNDDRE